MTMVDGSSNQTVDIAGEMDETRLASDSSDNSLGAFLARPIKIYSFDWTPSVDPGNDFQPWSLFLQNKRVSNRIANYRMLRGKLKVKILVNGNSFFYGRLMFSYLPLANFDDMSIYNTNFIDTVQMSQLPKILVDPTTSQGGEMTLPFFWHNDYLDLTVNDAESMGSLVISQLVALKHTSGDTTLATRASVSVYAWMEDVQLEAPTHTNPYGIVPQSTGISPYAKGSQMPHNSEPLNPEPQFVVPRPLANMALTDIKDSVNRMTFTSKQEVSLDPRILGLSGEDELNIKSIAKKESFLGNFLWSLDQSRENLLFNIRVTPALWQSSGNRMQFMACCGAVLPFQYWNGTFKLRLQFVSSPFHRGRVAVVYDPHSTPTGIGAVVREDNTAYTQIVDISECRDVTFCVGPNQHRTLLQYDPPAPSIPNVNFGATPLSFSGLGNGTVSIYVLNELTLPNAVSTINNDIAVNMFVSMDDDFEVFVPSSNFSSYTIRPQSTGVDVQTDKIDIVEVSQPDNTEILPLDQPNQVSSKRHLVFAGETMESFRHLLKRYYQWGAYRANFAGATTPTWYQFNHKAFPAYRGKVTGAVHKTATNLEYNYFQMTLMNYLAPAFQGWRGSIRYKMLPRCSQANPGRGTATVNFAATSAYGISSGTINLVSTSSAAKEAVFSGAFLARSAGAIVSDQYTNPVIEYEIPWWESMRFCPGKVDDWTTDNLPSRNKPRKGVNVLIDSLTSIQNVFDVHVSAGEDFTFYFFTGWPAMYGETIPPDPSLV